VQRRGTGAAEERLRNVTMSLGTSPCTLGKRYVRQGSVADARPAGSQAPATASRALGFTQIGDVARLEGGRSSATATAAPVTIHLLPPPRRSEGGRLGTGRKGCHCDPRGDQAKRNIPHDPASFCLVVALANVPGSVAGALGRSPDISRWQLFRLATGGRAWHGTVPGEFKSVCRESRWP
jgi:hypothetical protein